MDLDFLLKAGHTVGRELKTIILCCWLIFNNDRQIARKKIKNC